VIAFLLTATTYVAIQSILALGLNLQWGLAGLLNLAYILFMATGAYFSAVVVSAPALPPGTEYILGLQAPFVFGVLAGVLASTLLAVAVGAVALRNLRADYFAIVTLVIAVGAQQIVGQFRGLFNGSAGLVAIPQPLDTAFTGRGYAVFFLLMCCACTAVCFVIAEWLRKSPFGRALRALREDEDAAAAFGRNPYGLKLKAFVIGAGMAGLGGALLGAYVTAFVPAGWGVGETLLVLVCLFVGGSGNSVGAVVGTALVIGLLGQLPQLLPVAPSNPELIPDLRFMALGLLIILFLKWRPAGIFPERPTRLLTTRQRP
jgi:branched-chain amino acid transport system permease protein